MKKFLIIGISLLIVSCTGMKKANEFYTNQNYDLAIKECKRAIAQDSLNAEAHLILGKSYLAQKNLGGAIASFTTAYHIQPASKITEDARSELMNARLMKGDKLIADANHIGAVAEFAEVLKLDSTNCRAYFKLGNLYEEKRYLDRAKENYVKAARYTQDSVTVAKKLEFVDSLVAISDTNFEKALKFYKTGKNNSAIKYLNRAIQDKQDHKQAKYYSHMARGKIFYRKGSKTDCWNAIEEFGLAMTLMPKSAEPNFFMAKAYEKKDREEFDNAILQYQKALDKDPEGPFARASKKKVKDLTTRRNKLKEFWGK